MKWWQDLLLSVMARICPISTFGRTDSRRRTTRRPSIAETIGTDLHNRESGLCILGVGEAMTERNAIRTRRRLTGELDARPLARNFGQRNCSAREYLWWLSRWVGRRGGRPDCVICAGTGGWRSWRSGRWPP
jgi:hypothetical protein